MKNSYLLLILPFLFGQLNAQNLGFSSSKIIDNNFADVKKIQIGDLDNDGDLDVVASSSNASTSPNIVWYENNNFTFTKRTIDTNFYAARTVELADIDYDNDLDIIAVSREVNGFGYSLNAVTLYENDDISTNSWTKHALADTSEENHDVVVVDLNQDGYLDIITATAMQPDSPDTCIIWLENSGSNPGSFTTHIIPVNYQRLIAIDALDFDLDGDIDILAVDSGVFDDEENDPVIWYENDGSENFTERGITYTAFKPVDIVAGDIDKDGDLDPLVAIWGAEYDADRFHEIVWFENDGKAGNDPSKTWTEYIISQNVYTARSVQYCDLNGDDYLDVLAAASDQYDMGNGGYISYWINDSTPKVGTWTRNDIVTVYHYAYHAVPIDFDDDGDLDIIATAQDAAQIRWWENTINDSAQNIIVDTDYDLWNNKVRINFSVGPTGTEFVKIYFNNGEIQNSNLVDGPNVHHISEKGYYTFKTDMADDTCNIRFYYDNIAPWAEIDDAADLIICHWDGTEWVKTPNQSINVSSSYINISDFTKPNDRSVMFTLGSSTSDNPLPVFLSMFEAEFRKPDVHLTWATASEIENLGFELWRSNSADSNFVLIADYQNNQNLMGQGNTSQQTDYNYIDAGLSLNSTYFYKLYQVDFNGSRTELKTISVQTSESGNLPLEAIIARNYPNPFNGEMTIEFSINEPKEIRINIFDILGQRITELSSSVYQPGNHSVKWYGTDTHGNQVASGIYIYTITDSKGRLTAGKITYQK